MNDIVFMRRMKRTLAGILAAGMLLTGMPVSAVEAEKGTNAVDHTPVSGNDISGNDSSSHDVSGNDSSIHDISGKDKFSHDISGNDLTDYEDEAEEGGRCVVGGYIELPEDRDVSVVDETAPIDDYEDEFAPLMSDVLPSQYIPATGTLPRTRDQNPYGSCWAHASMALAEIDMMKNGGAGSAVDYSELHLAYFSYNGPVDDPLGGLDGDANYWTDKGINNEEEKNFMDRGGNLNLSQYVLANWVGAADESIAGYPSGSKKSEKELEALVSKDTAFQDAAHLQNAFQVDLKNNQNIAKQMILKYGGLGTSYWHADQYYNAADNSYYCDIQTTNHAVTIVGWDDSFSAARFKTTPEGNGAWLIRNSWVAGKDTDSRSKYTYFWLSYYDKSLAAGYAFDFESADNYDHNYQYDGSMCTATIPVSGDVANVFTAKADAERLEAVGVAFEKAQTPYTVSVYRNLEDPSDPESGTRIEEATTSGTCGCEGFYTIKLSNPVSLVKGDTFSVVVRYGAPVGASGSVDCPFESSYDSWFRSVASAKAGQSFWKLGSSWSDFGVQYKGNLRIKAYTVNESGGSGLPTEIRLGDELKDGIRLSVGESFQASCTVLPYSAVDKTVRWESDTPSVAKVDENGQITGVSNGTAKIEVSCNAAPSVCASFSVEVYTEVKSLEIKPPARTTYKTGEALDLSGGEVILISGESEESVPMRAEMISGFDAARAGICRVTVSYEGLTADFEVLIVAEPQVNVYCGQQLKEVSLPDHEYGAYSWADEETTFQQKGVFSAPVSFIPKDQETFQRLDNLQAQVTAEDPRTDGMLAYGELILQSEIFTYTGEEQKPAVTVTIMGDVLEESRDYTITYQNNKDAGTAAVTAEGMGSYHGNLNASFTIAPAQIRITAKDKTISVGEKAPGQGDYKYEVRGLLMDDRLIKEPAFYCEVAEAGTQEEGRYPITPSAADAGPNYTIIYEEGQLTVVDRRFGYQIALDEEDYYYYTGKAWKPAVSVYDGETLLRAGRDYTIKYVNNINANAGGVWKKGSGQGKDFNRNLPYVQITGKGNYTDVVEVNFDIHPAALADENGNPAKKVVLKYTDQFVAANKVLKPFNSIKCGKAMKLNTDYTLTLTAKRVRDGSGKTVSSGKKYENAQIPAGYQGEFTLTVEGKGNYEGSISRSVYVADQKSCLMKNAKITLGKNQKNVELVGEKVELTPSTENSADTFTVKLGGKVLKPGTDYQVSYLNGSNRRVGKATLVITGARNYSGTKTAVFNVKGKAFAAGKITVTGVEDKVYTGKAITQNKVSLVYNAGGPDEKKLKNGTDYTVSYSKNINRGIATMTFTGVKSKGFSGSFKKNFKISAASVETLKRGTGWNRIVAQYSKAGAKPDAEIVLTNADGVRLQNGKDYTLSYKNNRFVAAASGDKAPTVIVKGKGNYQGTFSIPFTIKGADLESKIESGEITVKTTAVAYQPDKSGDYVYRAAVKLMEGNTALRLEKDYTVTYIHNTQADYQAYMKSPGKAPAPQAVIAMGLDGTYLTGSRPGATISVPLTIYRNKLTKANLRVEVKESECVYTGSRVTPEVVVYYKGGNSEKRLEKGKDYTVSYGANVKSGKKAGRVTISGIGTLYGGDVTVNFAISRKKLDLK